MFVHLRKFIQTKYLIQIKTLLIKTMNVTEEISRRLNQLLESRKRYQELEKEYYDFLESLDVNQCEDKS